MKTKLHNLAVRAKVNAVRAAIASTALVVAGAAQADEGTVAIAALSTTASGYITAAFGVAIIVAGGFWGIAMMKKAFSKAG